MTKLQDRSNLPATPPGPESRPDRPAACNLGRRGKSLRPGRSGPAGRAGETGPSGVMLPGSKQLYLYSWAWQRRRPRGVFDSFLDGSGGGEGRGDSSEGREGRRVGPHDIKVSRPSSPEVPLHPRLAAANGVAAARAAFPRLPTRAGPVSQALRRRRGRLTPLLERRGSRHTRRAGPRAGRKRSREGEWRGPGVMVKGGFRKRGCEPISAVTSRVSG